MKKLAIILAMSAALAQAQTQPHPYAMNTAPVTQPAGAPSWFTRLPEDTPDMIFSAAVGVSTDEQMAYDKARIQAERKLVELMSARVRSNIKSYRNDRGDSMLESTEITVNKTADGELIGAQRVDSQATFDGRSYRAYVLLRYPLAQNNTLRQDRDRVQAKREVDLRAARAQQDLERETQRQRTEAEAADRKLKEEIGPRPESAVTPVSTVTPDTTVNTNDGPVKLLDVDNAEYKQRRDDALQKPGAVVGQTTVR